MAIEITTLGSVTPALGDKVIIQDVSETPDELGVCDLTALQSLIGGAGVSDGDKGDITVSGSGATWTIDNDVVTYAKMQNVSATNRVLGRSTAGAGDVEEIATTGSGDVVRATSPTLVTPALGTPASGTLTNCTGLPQAGTVGLTTADSPQFAGLNIGHASDTTLSRSAAGVLAVEGVDQVSVSGTQTLSAKKIQLNAALGTDDTCEGITIAGKNAGETLVQWAAVYLKSDGKWWIASAESGVAIPAHGMAVSAGTADNPLTVLTYGTVRNDAWAWTVGGSIYLDVDGAITQTAPAVSGDIVQKVGFAISADIAFFDFNSTIIAIA